jgi:hypothetical protein
LIRIRIRRSPKCLHPAQPGSVVNAVQPGYTTGERLLRPAMVTVAKADGQAPSPNGSGNNVDTKA